MASSIEDKAIPSTSHEPVIHSPLMYEKNTFELKNGPFYVYTLHPITELISQNSLGNSTKDSEKSAKHPKSFNDRLATFNSKWKVDFITPCEMAKAGFSYTGIRDCVRCNMCSMVFDKWVKGDVALDEHKRHSPECAFLKNTIEPDVCGIYNYNYSKMSPDDTKLVQEFLGSMIVQLNKPHGVHYVSLNSRLKSFNYSKHSFTKVKNTLSDAGFCYVGNENDDIVMCFYCGQNLHNWEEDDDPWTEHAKWSADCSYVLLSKGKHFVEKIKNEENNAPKNHPEETSKMKAALGYIIAICEPEIHGPGSSSNIESSEPLDNGQEGGNSKENDTDTFPDSVLCKICFKERINVAFVPCGHVVACSKCTFAIDMCAICRIPLKMAMRVHVDIDEGENEGVDQPLPVLSQNLAVQSVCKVCKTNAMEVAFMPCGHICACLKCASQRRECPLCFEKFYAFMQVYL